VGEKKMGALLNIEEEGLPSCVRTKESGKEEGLFRKA
jgi:hypothetical protein